MSKQSKQKQKKRLNRRKAYEKIRNIANNRSPAIWRLDIQIEGRWYDAREFRKREVLDAQLADTEERRKAGEVVVPGRVVHLETGKIIQTIEGSGEQPKVKGPKDAKRELVETSEADKKGVLGSIFGKKDAKIRIPEPSSQ